MKYVFGPVPSRRLGLSLGVDVVQEKICTLDCVYCQVGLTKNRTLERRCWVPAAGVIAELRQVIERKADIDYITFSGSGEPTLHAELGGIIEQIKGMCDYPVAVLTNGTLLDRPDVRADLMRADLVVPSLDAVTPEVFRRINRPHADLDVGAMLQGLTAFSGQYRGRLWIEIMLVKGINDGEAELRALRQVLQQLECEKIQINTVTRPAAEKDALAVSAETLSRARGLFGARAEEIGIFKKGGREQAGDDVGDRILQVVRRRPCSCGQISASLGLPHETAAQAIGQLVAQGLIEKIDHGGDWFYRALGR